LFGTIRLQASSYKKHAVLSPVGASLLANRRLRQCPLIGTIRLQASSYKKHATLPPVFVGASLLANRRLRQCPLFGTIRLQASSYKKHAVLSPVVPSLLAIRRVRPCTVSAHEHLPRHAASPKQVKSRAPGLA
jgi:hypothetical protein